MHYEYAGRKPLIGETEPKVRYIKDEGGKLVSSLMPYTVALEVINGAASVEESEEQERFNNGGIVIDGGAMLFSMADFKAVGDAPRARRKKAEEAE